MVKFGDQDRSNFLEKLAMKEEMMNKILIEMEQGRS
jgi:hypothetical protein